MFCSGIGKSSLNMEIVVELGGYKFVNIFLLGCNPVLVVCQAFLYSFKFILG